MIKTKLKTLQAFTTVLTSVFFAIISIALIGDSSSKMEGSPGEVAFAFFTAFFAIYLPYNLLQNCPRIIFEEDSITVKYLFNTKKYVWSSITDIFFSAGEYNAFLKILGRDMESTCMHFDNNEKIILWEDWYSNLPTIRQYIFAKAKVKVRDKQSTLEKSSLIFETKVYAGNPWITTNTATMLIPAIFFTISLGNLNSNSIYLFLLLIIPFLICFFAIGTQMNYFIVSGENFTIKNHFFFWKKRIFNIHDINGFVFESQYRRSNALRILTKEFESKKFAAGSLRDKHWLSFKKDMIAIGIPVRSEILL